MAAAATDKGAAAFVEQTLRGDASDPSSPQSARPELLDSPVLPRSTLASREGLRREHAASRSLVSCVLSTRTQKKTTPPFRIP